MKKYILLLLAIVVSNNLFAQLTITLPLAEPAPSNSVEVLSADFMTDEVTLWGNVSNGELSFSLDYDYLKKALEEAKKQQAEAPEGWTLSFHTVGSKHECSKYSSENTVAVNNPEAKIMGLPPFFAGNLKKKERFGDLYVASSKEMAKWLFDYQMGSAPLGFYVEWIFVESEASVLGTCSINTMTGHGNEEFVAATTYNLNFIGGWNAVVYQIAEVFESESGQNFAKQWNIYTATFLPEDVQCFILEGE